MKSLITRTIIIASIAIACNDSKSNESTIDSSAAKIESTGVRGNVVKNDTDKINDIPENIEDTHEFHLTDIEGQPDTEKFILEAASGGMMEVDLGKYALKNAISPKVKEFGQMMITDHSKANTELREIATQKKITLSVKALKKHQEHIEKLKAKKGVEFDKAYMEMMIRDHNEDMIKFQVQSKAGNDEAVKAFATATLPVLIKHLKQANEVYNSLQIQ